MSAFLPANPSPDLIRMRRIATSALVVVVIVMIIARILEATHPGLGYVRAFCEAATVGALADWFAVVALFRHPMGLPIPHTAILPNNKPRVADSLARFIETSFLTEAQLGPHFRKLDYAAHISRWLTSHADFLAEKASDYLPRAIAELSDEKMSGLLAEQARAMMNNADLAPIAGEGLNLLIQNGRDRAVYAGLLRSAEELILANRPMIQTKIQEEIPIPVDILKGVPGLNRLGPVLEEIKSQLAEAVASRTIEKIRRVLMEAERQEDHSLWKSFDSQLRKFIADLKTSPEMAAQIRAMQGTLTQSTVVDDFATRAWLELKAYLVQDCTGGNSKIRARLREAILSLAAQIGGESPTGREINAFLGEQVLKSLLGARPHAREWIVSTIDRWDAKEMAARLESTVGPDLQYIRLNGTLIGGLIGLFIHAMFELAAWWK